MSLILSIILMSQYIKQWITEWRARRDVTTFLSPTPGHEISGLNPVARSESLAAKSLNLQLMSVLPL
jgi:hypothetical protein